MTLKLPTKLSFKTTLNSNISLALTNDVSYHRGDKNILLRAVLNLPLL